MSEPSTTDVADTEVEETATTTDAPEGADTVASTETTDDVAAGDATDTIDAYLDDDDDEQTDADEDADDDDETDEGVEGGTAREGSGRSRRQVLEREGEVAADFLETLLDICDLDGDIDVDIDGDRAAVSVVDSEDGRVPRRLVGDSGKVLDALQELTRLAVQSATGERSRLMLDVAGHRAERRESLVELAAEAIAEVKASGERKPLTPMTAFERKVVHDEVLAAGLSSESEGAEPRRFVVILPA